MENLRTKVEITRNVLRSEKKKYKCKIEVVTRAEYPKGLINHNKDYVLFQRNGICDITIDLNNNNVLILFNGAYRALPEEEIRERIMEILFDYTQFDLIRDILFNI